MAKSGNCPKCSTAIIGNSDRCESCQTVFWQYITLKQDELSRQTRQLAEKKRRAETTCPKCDAALTDDPSGCKHCGVIVEKFLTRTDRDLKAEAQHIAEAAEAEKGRKIRREEEHRKILEEAIVEARQKESGESSVSESGSRAAEAIQAMRSADNEAHPQPKERKSVEPQRVQKDKWKKEAEERWKEEARQRMQDLAAGKSVSFAQQSSPRVDAMPDKKRPQRIRETRQHSASLRSEHRQSETREFIEIDGFTSKIVMVLKFGGWGWLAAGILCLAYSLFNNESLLLGGMAFLQGAFGCILFLAVGNMAEKVARIAEKLDVNE